jgi:signal transduction histidine kinase
MQFMNVDLGPMVEEVVRRYSNLARQRKIKMKVHKEVGAIVWGNAGRTRAGHDEPR